MAGRAQMRTCAGCKTISDHDATLRAAGSKIELEGNKSPASELRISGAYQMNATGDPPIRADFPIEIRASEGHLLVTALMPMEEYIAGVLAGETGNFKSDEALKAMAVAARTYAMHFGSRHALEGFDFCDTTHCQDLRIAGIDAHLRSIADATAGEVLWYDGEPAATYYHANCGGTTEDGHFVLGNNEARGAISGAALRSVLRAQRRRPVAYRGFQARVATRARGGWRRLFPARCARWRFCIARPADAWSFCALPAAAAITVPALAFRSAIGRHIGWERLKSNWYDVSDAGDRLIFHGRGSGHGVGLCQIGAEVMGEEGHSYREILSFYYPGTRLGVSAQGIPWQQLANEDVTLLTTRPDRDRSLLALATGFVHESEESTGLVYRASPRLKIYPTSRSFSQLNWRAGMGGSFDSRTHHPDAALRRVARGGHAGEHDSSRAAAHADRLVCAPGTPLWFREGLVLYLTAPNAAF